MKYIRLIMAVALTFLVCSAFTMKKDKEKPVYVFGVAASFTDTLVYYTDIQLLDSVYLNEHGFLPQRDLYSYQLKNHLEYNMNKLNYTCVIYFSDNKKKLERGFESEVGLPEEQADLAADRGFGVSVQEARRISVSVYTDVIF